MAAQAAVDMLKLATESKEELKDLPFDLRKRADEILYSKGVSNTLSGLGAFEDLI